MGIFLFPLGKPFTIRASISSSLFYSTYRPLYSPSSTNLLLRCDSLLLEAWSSTSLVDWLLSEFLNSNIVSLPIRESMVTLLLSIILNSCIENALITHWLGKIFNVLLITSHSSIVHLAPLIVTTNFLILDLYWEIVSF